MSNRSFRPDNAQPASHVTGLKNLIQPDGKVNVFCCRSERVKMIITDLSSIKLVIFENGKLLESITKDTSTQPKQLIKSLENFQQSANAVLTNLIETQGESVNVSDEAEEDEEDEDEDEQVSPKKRKKIQVEINSYVCS